jgi:putative acetyltransferase
VNESDDVIRPMLPGEAGEVSRIIVAAIRAGLPGHYAPEVVEALAAGNSPEAVAGHAPKQTDFVLVRGGRAVAMIGLKRNEIGHLFVDPACAGRGIGAALVAFAAAEFRRAGHADMVVLASLNARGFYSRCGFVEESRGSFPVGQGLSLDYVRMRSPLGSG